MVKGLRGSNLKKASKTVQKRGDDSRLLFFLDFWPPVSYSKITLSGKAHVWFFQLQVKRGGDG
jgi:hypothetical protein